MQNGRKKKENKIVPEVRIERLAAEGQAIGHLPDGKVVFVPYGAPGDLVDVQILRSRKSYAEGRIVRYAELSPERETPKCPHFGVCGGCKWQHIPYALQLATKEQSTYDQLERIGGVDIREKRPIIGADTYEGGRTYGYRNKLEFTFSNNRWIPTEEMTEGVRIDDRDGLGFHIPGRFDRILDIEECHLMPGLNDRIRLYVKEYCLTHEGFGFFDLRSHEGVMRNLMIRTSESGEVMAVVVFAQDLPEQRDELLSAVRETFPEISSLMYITNAKANDSIADREVHLFSGLPFMTEEMEGLKFKVGPKSFYQTNSAGAHALYKVARDFALGDGDASEQLLYDLYTGTGTIASFVARRVKKVIGIEYVEEAVEGARENVLRNGIRNAEFFAGDMKDILTEDFVNRHGKPDVIITDPPRAGMHPSVIRVITEVARPSRIVYVSCNPASQARDMLELGKHYRALISQPVDMFPQTHHVENVLLLERIPNGDK